MLPTRSYRAKPPPTPQRSQQIREDCCASRPYSEQRLLVAAGRLQADSVVTLRREHAALRGAGEIAFLDQERFVHFLERVGFLADRDRDGAESDGTALVV